MEKEVMFCYGALSDSLEQQANSQGYTLGEESELLHKLNNSMIMCWVHGLCTDSQQDSMMKKLQKKVMKALKPLEKEVEEDED